MRQTKKFQIEGHAKGFEVKELTVKQIVTLVKDNLLDSEKDISLNSLIEMFSDGILAECSNVKIDDIMEMSPSEVKQLWEHFSGVNDSFFVTLKSLGLDKVLKTLQANLLKDFSEMLAGSSRQDT